MRKIVGIVVSLVIGGTVYTFSQADLIENFSKETGLTQQEAQQYVENIPEDDLATFDEIGSELVVEGKYSLSMVDEIDCVNYEYEWESPSLTCNEGKAQLKKIGNSEIALGKAYIELDAEDAGGVEMNAVIRNIDRLNKDYDLEIFAVLLDPQDIEEMKKTNSYNKALIQSALESD